ncbi:ATP-binding protein [Scopulibacillus darangshiensis]|nr:ATP-binding protein [Scopulibacillus darangshiensis]
MINKLEEKIEALENELYEARRQLEYYQQASHYTPCSIMGIIEKNGTLYYNFIRGRWSDCIQPGKPVEKSLPESVRNVVPNLLNYYQTALTGKHIHFETQIDNQAYSTSLYPVTNNGEVTEIISTTTEITAQHTDPDTEVNQAKFLAAFEQSLDGMIIFNDEGKRIAGNLAACRIFGQTMSEFMDENLYPNNRKARLISLFHEGKLNGELTIMRKGGRARVVEYYTKGNILPGLHLSVIRDITERKALEERLHKSDKIRMAGTLAATLAHEIRNPLTGLTGFLQLLQKRLGERNEYHNNEEFPRYVDVMLHETKEIERLISKLLLLDEPEDETFLQNEKLDKILDDCISKLEFQAAINCVEIEKDIAPGNYVLPCCKKQIQQLFYTVLHNGMASMEPQSTLKVKLYEKESSIIITFTDQGKGIPLAFAEKFGEPLYITKEKGTGLDLMVCYHIVENYKGKIDVNSEKNRGTTIQIELPINGKCQYAAAK